jgi:ABC-type phosphate/phosphonate transport system substrate-binding protein
MTPRRTALAALILLLLSHGIKPGWATEVSGADGDPTLINISFSRTLFAGSNENDAKAAVKVYAQTLAEKNGVTTGYDHLVLEDTNAISTALRLNQVDLLSVTAEEFFELEAQGLSGPLLLTEVRGSFTEQYVLLVRDASPIRSVTDLKGHNVNVADDLRSSLALIWLEVLCQERGLGPATGALSKITRASKATQIVLPVFFGKADACVITRNGWEVMGELNPQVKKQLRAVEQSPPVVPTVTCFRSGFSERLKHRITEVAVHSFNEPSFRQLMGLFKTDGFGQQPVAALDSTRELVAKYQRLCTAPIPAGAAAPQPDTRPSVDLKTEAK